MRRDDENGKGCAKLKGAGQEGVEGLKRERGWGKEAGGRGGERERERENFLSFAYSCPSALCFAKEGREGEGGGRRERESDRKRERERERARDGRERVKQRGSEGARGGSEGGREGEREGG